MTRLFLDEIDTILLDCDGVLWSGEHVLPGIVDTLRRLRTEKKKRLFFVTNNSTLSRESYVQKFTKYGIEATKDDIISSAYATALALQQRWSTAASDAERQRKVYVIGEVGITAELDALQIAWCGSTQETREPLQRAELATFAEKQDPSVAAVVMGFDSYFSYRKLATAHYHLAGRPDAAEVAFIATNTDATYLAGPHLFPGTGAMVAAVQKSTGRDPIVIGKPNEAMLETVLKAYDLNPARTLMVGDRLDTDIAFGKRGRLHTLLVLSGVTKREELAHLAETAKPDVVLPTLNELLTHSV